MQGAVFAFRYILINLKYYVNIYYFKQQNNDCFYKTFLLKTINAARYTIIINLQPLYFFSLVNRGIIE